MKEKRQLKKEIKKLRKLVGREALEKQHWKKMYDELNHYIEWKYKDY